MFNAYERYLLERMIRVVEGHDPPHDEVLGLLLKAFFDLGESAVETKELSYACVETLGVLKDRLLREVSWREEYIENLFAWILPRLHASAPLSEYVAVDQVVDGLLRNPACPTSVLWRVGMDALFTRFWGNVMENPACPEDLGIQVALMRLSPV